MAIECLLVVVYAKQNRYSPLRFPLYRTVAVECCYQNVGIATSLALTMFQGNDLNNAMGIPFFYGTCEAVLVGLYCVGCWKLGWSKAPSDESFWKVLLTTYEVVEDTGDGSGAVELSQDAPAAEGASTTYVQMEDGTKKASTSVV